MDVIHGRHRSPILVIRLELSEAVLFKQFGAGLLTRTDQNSSPYIHGRRTASPVFAPSNCINWSLVTTRRLSFGILLLIIGCMRKRIKEYDGVYIGLSKKNTINVRGETAQQKKN